MTRKTKKLITEEINLEKAEQYFADYAVADAKIQQITAKMDQEMTKIREKYQEDLAKFGQTRDESFEKLQHFATNKPELFPKKKSYEMAHGIIGFRTGTPALKAIKGYTWAAICNLVKKVKPEFVRTKEEVNKELILDTRETEETIKLMAECGIVVEQAESFYVEPKKETVI